MAYVFFSVIQEEWTPGRKHKQNREKEIFSKDRPGFKYVSIFLCFLGWLVCLVFDFFYT